mgnify:CR=1 FL=1
MRAACCCARDRLGVKPFYYQWDGRRVRFRLGAQARWCSPSRSRIAPRLAAIRDLVALDWVDHEAATFFEGSCSLPPGHLLTIGEGELAPARAGGSSIPTRRAAGNARGLDARVRRAVHRRRAHPAARRRRGRLVPLGRTRLERGGHHRGAAREPTAARVHLRLRRRPGVRRAALRPRHGRRRAARSRTSWCRTALIFWATFDRLTYQQDEPTAGPGVYSQWKVMELAQRTELKCAARRTGRRRDARRLLALPAAAAARPARRRAARSLHRQWRDVARPARRRTRWRSRSSPGCPRALVAPLRRAYGQGKDRVLAHDAARSCVTTRPLRPPRGFRARSRRSRHSTCASACCPRCCATRIATAWRSSIETRLPFLDYRLVEFAFALPDEQKLDGRDVPRPILRRALADRDSAQRCARGATRWDSRRPPTCGCSGRYAREVERRLAHRRVRCTDWLEPAAVAAALDSYRAGLEPIGLQVWRWLSLESWARQFLVGATHAWSRRPASDAMHPARRLRRGTRRGRGAVARSPERRSLVDLARPLRGALGILPDA